MYNFGIWYYKAIPDHDNCATSFFNQVKREVLSMSRESELSEDQELELLKTISKNEKKNEKKDENKNKNENESESESEKKKKRMTTEVIS